MSAGVRRARSQVAEVDRAGAADLGQLATDVGSVPNQIGAVLLLDHLGEVELADLQRVIGDRLAGVPRLRQRLVTAGRGGGGAVWVEDPGFDVARHLEVVDCPAPGDEPALLALAAGRVTAPLPATAPRWQATLVTGLVGGGVALIVVFHHVLADGLGGLAVLARLVDEGAAVPAGPAAAAGPRPAGPGPGLRSRLARARRRLAEFGPRLRAVRRELGDRPTFATRCSLNHPTGRRREVAVVRAELAALKGFAHAHGGASVNDVLIGAVAGALGTLLRRRGEHVDEIVATVMVAAVPAGAPAGPAAGNQAGIAPIALPTGGTLAERLPVIAALTRARKQGRRGASAAPLGVVLRILARLHLLRWFIDHQRMVHTFVTNLRGPAVQVSIAGVPVIGLVPISLATGNVTVAFAAMSYAGTVTITVVTDPTHHPDRDVLLRALEEELVAPQPRS